MNNLFISTFFVAVYDLTCGQIPAVGSLLWLRANVSAFNNNSGTQLYQSTSGRFGKTKVQ